MTVMDEICGWGEEENGWDVNLQHVCGSTIYNKSVLCDGQETTQNFLKRMLSIVWSVNCACGEVLVEHEWVHPLTISLKEKRSVEGIGLQTRCSVCGRMVISLVYRLLKIKCVTGLSKRKIRQEPRGEKLGHCVCHQ